VDEERTAPGVPAQRAGDADREHAAERLRLAGADGRLTVEELEQRLSASFAARTKPELSLVLSVMGGCEIDLTKAELVHPVTTIRAVAIMGGTEIRGPDGAVVHVSKLAITGGFDVELGTRCRARARPRSTSSCSR
jgi:hypothetical protein